MEEVFDNSLTSLNRGRHLVREMPRRLVLAEGGQFVKHGTAIGVAFYYDTIVRQRVFFGSTPDFSVIC